MNIAVISDTLASMIRIATPLMLMALGGLLCDRAGVFNIAMEGFALVGAFAAVACVQFSGGKFPYDNDSVQLCFSRPDGDGTNAVSRVMLMGSVSDEACVVRPVENIRHPEEISLSIQKTEDGYELLADIPFHCLGGAPEQGEVWGFDLLVNDRDSGVRRDLQLIWSGALPGERLYLREDHHDASRFGMIRF